MTKEESEALQRKLVEAVRLKNKEDSWGQKPEEEWIKRKENGEIEMDEWGNPVVDWATHAPNNGGVLATRKKLPGLPSTLTVDRFGGEGGRMVAVKVNGEPAPLEARSLPYVPETIAHPQNYASNGTKTIANLNEWYNGLPDFGDNGTSGKTDVLEYIANNMDENNILDYVDFSEERNRQAINLIHKSEGAYEKLLISMRNDITKENPNLTENQIQAKLNGKMTKYVLSRIYAHERDENNKITNKYIYDPEVRAAMVHSTKVKLRIFAAKVSPAFGRPGGGVQIEFPVSIEMMKEAGMIVDDEQIGQKAFEKITTMYEAAKKENPDLTVEQFWASLSKDQQKELGAMILDEREEKIKEEPTGPEETATTTPEVKESTSPEETTIPEVDEPTGPEESETITPEVKESTSPEETTAPEVDEPTGPEESETTTPEVGEPVSPVEPKNSVVTEEVTQPKVTRSPGEVREAAEADIDYNNDAAAQVIEQIKSDLIKEVKGKTDKTDKTDMDLSD